MAKFVNLPNHLRPVAHFPRLELGINIGHHAGDHINHAFHDFLHIVLKMKVMQKLRKHFPAGAFPHGLLHIISQIIGIQPVSPENSLILAWALKWGWAATTMLILHPESLKVIRAPLPGIFPENFSIILRSLFPFIVTVKLSQFRFLPAYQRRCPDYPGRAF